MDLLRILETFWSRQSVAFGLSGWVIPATAILCIALYLLRGRNGSPVSWAGFRRYAFPRSIYAHRSARLDLQMFMFNIVIGAVLLAPLLAISTITAGWTSMMLNGLLGVREQLPDGDGWPSAWLTLALLWAMDAGFFLSHRLQHKLPWLWEFHKVHHSAPVLNPLSAYRQHPVDQFVDGASIGVATGITFGIFHYGYMGVAEPLSAMGYNLGVYVFYLTGAHLRHSHIWLGYPRWLSRILISPAQHQIHHSAEPRHRDVNFGGIFAVWDALAGTLYVPSRRESFPLGLPEREQRAYSSLVGLYVVPIYRAVAQFKQVFDRSTPKEVMHHGDNNA